jgi:hypothetical protein
MDGNIADVMEKRHEKYAWLSDTKSCDITVAPYLIDIHFKYWPAWCKLKRTCPGKVSLTLHSQLSVITLLIRHSVSHSL